MSYQNLIYCQHFVIFVMLMLIAYFGDEKVLGSLCLGFAFIFFISAYCKHKYKVPTITLTLEKKTGNYKFYAEGTNNKDLAMIVCSILQEKSVYESHEPMLKQLEKEYKAGRLHNNAKIIKEDDIC